MFLLYMQVVIEEAISEAQRSGKTNITNMAAMLGFAIMMVLDVGVGVKIGEIHGDLPLCQALLI